MSLRFSDGRSLPVAQSGPGFVILRDPAPFPGVAGEHTVLAIVIDGVGSESRVRLVERLEAGAMKVLVG
jgi:hypothetical protein